MCVHTTAIQIELCICYIKYFSSYSTLGPNVEKIIDIINIKPKRKARLVETIVLDNEENSVDNDQVISSPLLQTADDKGGKIEDGNHKVLEHHQATVGLDVDDETESSPMSCDQVSGKIVDSSYQMIDECEHSTTEDDVVITAEEKILDADDIVKDLITMSGLTHEEFCVDDNDLKDVVEVGDSVFPEQVQRINIILWL